MKFYGVVILYNPDFNVISNIETYLPFLDCLYVMDNSEKHNLEIIDYLKQYDNIIYTDNKGNKGISYSLNKAMEFARQDNATWVLTMDQDSKFEKDQFFTFKDFVSSQDDKQVGIISPFHKSVIIGESKGEVEEQLIVMTSGNFISNYVFQTLNGFDERFFIDAVDWDYCLQVNLKGFKILRLNFIQLDHQLGNNAHIVKGSFGKLRLIQNYNYIRRYYITRNKLLMISKYKKSFPNLSLRWFISLGSDVRNILLYETDRLIKIKSIFIGIYDFIFSKFGKKEF